MDLFGCYKTHTLWQREKTMLFQSIRHGSLHVFNSPKMVSFQAGFEPGKQKEIGRDSPDLGCGARFLFVSVTNALKEISVQDFQASYDAWQNRWQRCIDAQGCYFEEY